MFYTAPFAWAVSHLPVIGWPALIYACYRLIIVCFKIGRAAVAVETRVLKGEETLHLLATNHLPHVEAAINANNLKVDETNRLLLAISNTLGPTFEERYQSIRKHTELNRAEMQQLREFVLKESEPPQV